jgi:hypothetical protein
VLLTVAAARVVATLLRVLLAWVGLARLLGQPARLGLTTLAVRIRLLTVWLPRLRWVCHRRCLPCVPARDRALGVRRRDGVSGSQIRPLLIKPPRSALCTS